MAAIVRVQRRLLTFLAFYRVSCIGYCLSGVFMGATGAESHGKRDLLSLGM
jgi:hypothetical protein